MAKETFINIFVARNEVYSKYSPNDINRYSIRAKLLITSTTLTGSNYTDMTI